MIRAFVFAVTIFALVGMPVKASQTSKDEFTQKPFIIFSASSLYHVLNKLTAEWTHRTSSPLPIISIGPSATMARQIIGGAPADLFISAHPYWSNLVAKSQEGGVKPVALATNRLVLIPPFEGSKTANPKPAWTSDYVNHIMQNRRLVIADPAMAPAGQYAKTALEQLLGHKITSTNLILAPDATRAFFLVQKGGKPGILYRSYAVQKKLSDAILIPSDMHEPIEYTAVKASTHNSISDFLNWLNSADAKKIWNTAGFETN